MLYNVVNCSETSLPFVTVLNLVPASPDLCILGYSTKIEREGQSKFRDHAVKLSAALYPNYRHFPVIMQALFHGCFCSFQFPQDGVTLFALFPHTHLAGT